MWPKQLSTKVTFILHIIATRCTSRCLKAARVFPKREATLFLSEFQLFAYGLYRGRTCGRSLWSHHRDADQPAKSIKLRLAYRVERKLPGGNEHFAWQPPRFGECAGVPSPAFRFIDEIKNDERRFAYAAPGSSESPARSTYVGVSSQPRTRRARSSRPALRQG
jgi:hypothetical protein